MLTWVFISLVLFAARQTYARSVPQKRHGLKEAPEPPDPVTLK